uniref:Uncharacterized protein n=1 Tax=viral metagenome TaxID=1070528 RepID=A0A6C0BAX6_9ZZZZ
MNIDSREETLRLLENVIKTKVQEGANIPTKPEHKWRDIPDLIRRLLTVIPATERALIRDLQQYNNTLARCAQFVIKAAYTHDTPLQIMRMHIITIMEQYDISISNTRPWTIAILWQRYVVEIFHSLRYDNERL